MQRQPCLVHHCWAVAAPTTKTTAAVTTVASAVVSADTTATPGLAGVCTLTVHEHRSQCLRGAGDGKNFGFSAQMIPEVGVSWQDFSKAKVYGFDFLGRKFAMAWIPRCPPSSLPRPLRTQVHILGSGKIRTCIGFTIFSLHGARLPRAPRPCLVTSGHGVWRTWAAGRPPPGAEGASGAPPSLSVVATCVAARAAMQQCIA